ncbi:MAG: hypothetical protein KDC38_02865 [Planctomycetes bacterium]|nr:hypothetical protein [Planctomycetota bacterium]
MSWQRTAGILLAAATLLVGCRESGRELLSPVIIRDPGRGFSLELEDARLQPGTTTARVVGRIRWQTESPEYAFRLEMFVDENDDGRWQEGEALAVVDPSTAAIVLNGANDATVRLEATVTDTESTEVVARVHRAVAFRN